MATTNPDRAKLDGAIATFSQTLFPELVSDTDYTARLQLAIGELLVKQAVCRLVDPDNYWEASALLVGDEAKTGHGTDNGVVVLVQLGHFDWGQAQSSTRVAVTIEDTTEDAPWIEGLRLDIDFGTPRSMAGTYAQTDRGRARIHGEIFRGERDSVRIEPTGNMVSEHDTAFRLQQAARIITTCAIGDLAAALLGSDQALNVRHKKTAHDNLQRIA